MSKPNYYSILPAEVRYDKDLSSSQKIFYSEITALSNKYGYCNASNKYFAELYDVSTVTISRWLTVLRKKGYVIVELSEETGNERKIFINYERGLNKNVKRGLNKNVMTPINKNVKHNNTSNNITSNNIYNNIVPKDEIEKIYDTLPDYWKVIFQDYISIYESKNKSKKITESRHLKLLDELYQIYHEMRFNFDGKKYKLTPEIFEKGINTIIEKEIDNLNYAKQVWITEITRKSTRQNKKAIDEDKHKEFKRSEYR